VLRKRLYNRPRLYLAHALLVISAAGSLCFSVGPGENALSFGEKTALRPAAAAAEITFEPASSLTAFIDDKGPLDLTKYKNRGRVPNNPQIKSRRYLLHLAVFAPQSLTEPDIFARVEIFGDQTPTYYSCCSIPLPTDRSPPRLLLL
jgi:hypothetical protein